ncbi:MAG: hypothetical protein PHV11_07805 [Candidatus Bipolaricaulis sp.]|nr:hypothetical protein [Candidatus Bipolaricaulis sp.]
MNAGDAAASFLRIGATSEIAVEGDGFLTLWDGAQLFAVLPEAVAPSSVVTVKLQGVGGAAIELASAELGTFGAAWMAQMDATSAVVTVLNVGAKDATKIVVNSYTYMAEAVEGFDITLAQGGGTQLVITLPVPLAPGATITFKVDAADVSPVKVQSVALY